jgi:hypothetical protein
MVLSISAVLVRMRRFFEIVELISPSSVVQGVLSACEVSADMADGCWHVCQENWGGVKKTSMVVCWIA